MLTGPPWGEGIQEWAEKAALAPGGAEYDAKYPDGIPTSMVVTDEQGATPLQALVLEC